MSRRRPISVGGHRSRSVLTVLADRDAAGPRTAVTAPVANSHDLDRASNPRGTPPATLLNGFGRPELAGPRSARPTGCSRCPPGRGGPAAEPGDPLALVEQDDDAGGHLLLVRSIGDEQLAGQRHDQRDGLAVGVVGHPGGPVRGRWTALGSTSPWLRRGVGGRR